MYITRRMRGRFEPGRVVAGLTAQACGGRAGVVRHGEGTNPAPGVYLQQRRNCDFHRGAEPAFYLQSKAQAPMFRLHLTGCSDRIP
jgi:hypothetical protein